jgi:hypothetical protein
MFYEFNQNNSGGGFESDFKRGISNLVIIEADSPEEANDKAQRIGLYFDGCDSGTDCDCCGDRWYRTDTREGKESPEVYGKSVAPGDPFSKDNNHPWSTKRIKDGPEGFIHYKDGSFKGFWE